MQAETAAALYERGIRAAMQQWDLDQPVPRDTIDADTDQ